MPHLNDNREKQPRIVIVGAGFGGLFCAKRLVDAPARITLIDRQNHHLFQPLLYQVATGFLGINDVALPVRSLFKNKGNIEVVMAEVTGLDREKRQVLTNGPSYSYDYLVLATGAAYHYFGHDEWAKHVLVLKNLEDAIALRQQILSSFERAELESDPGKRRRLLTYVIIGGGPTGVEMAGAIADAVNYALKREFRHITPEDTHIRMIEAGPRLLSTMPEKLSAYAKRVLERKGVVVQCGTPVQDIRAGKVTFDGETLESDVIIWAAGVKPLPLAGWLDLEADRRGGIPVTANLSVPGHPEIFIAGDAATYMQNGKTLPAVAPVAKQQGKYIAKFLRHRLAAKSYSKPFRYIDYGNTATIGRNAAVADFGRFTLKGWIGWCMWGIAHIYFLTGFRNRSVVFLTWLWTYLTYGMGARIILRGSPRIH
jgi:NADH:ubiquinone reductase (H+-translocating)